MLNKSRWSLRLLNYLFLIVILVITLVPVYVIMTNAFRQTLDIKKMPPELFFKPTLVHFQRIIQYDNFLKYFLNSTIIAVTVTVTTIGLGTLTAYGLKLFKSRLGERLSNFLLLGKLVPSITILIPLFVMLNRVRLTGTYVGPILAHSAMGLPFVTWMMASFVRDIPNEILESACVEGSSRMRTFYKIIFPMLTPAIASAVILIMQFSWNELMFSLQLTNIKTYPLTVGIARYVGAVSVDWGKSSVAATIAMVPIICIGFAMQKYLVSGMTAGAVKS
ncbi:MAG: carbohydrate ABC transporter permease [Spirochaetaceae bacterium]|nr:carbohydrate ABC transporter permease [Spirochaetaceae bacterium]MDT8298632.1 carbohydrate ABC transporter permease [Spirochaetaceae bacterium]